MAITRCPYCHAIIDENDKYCNNCGTQLLFPEDDEVDEEIPGEKILDADVEDKDYTIDEPAGENNAAGVIDLDEDLVGELEEKTGELALDKLVEEEAEEVILVDEIEAAGAGGEGGPEEPKSEEETAELESGEEEEGEEEDEDEDEDEDEAEGPEGGDEPGEKAEEGTREIVVAPEDAAEPVIEYITDGREEEAAAAEPAAGPEPRPATFDTGELDGIGRTVELGKVKIDEFLEVLAEKAAEPEPPPKTAREPSGTLPPWASTMKGAPVFPDETGPAEAAGETAEEGTKPLDEEETEIFPRRRDSDSTIGLPERLGQSPLPFEPAAAEDEGAEGEPLFPPRPSPRPGREAARPASEPERRPFEPAGEAAEEAEPAGPRPPFSFSTFFKSKAFDILFVGLFWLVALWLAAHSLGTTLFAVLGSMSGPMLLLYAVFVCIYFFLFKFFLGETLGDRLFRERDEP